MSKQNIQKRKGNSLYIGENTLNRPFIPTENNVYEGLNKVSQVLGTAQNVAGTINQVGNALNAVKDIGKDLGLNSNSKLSGLVGKVSGAAGKAVPYLGVAAGGVSAFKAGQGLRDRSDLDVQIDAARNSYTNAQSFDELEDYGNTLQGFNSLGASSFRNPTGQRIGKGLVGVGTSALSGAKAAGVPGAIAGAAVGLAGWGLGNWNGNAKSRFLADQYSLNQNEAWNSGINSALYAQDNASQVPLNAAYISNNIGAYGGEIYNDYMNRKAYGGNLDLTGDFTNGLTFINNGGTHEQNPLDGVPMGVDGDGTPNLVEEGEAIYDDYVYSNRLFLDGGDISKSLLPKELKNTTYAKAAEKLARESEDRPLDPISKRTLDANMTRLRNNQEEKRERKREDEARQQFEALPPEYQQALVQDAQQRMMQPEQGQQPEEMNPMMMQNPYGSLQPDEGIGAFGGNLFNYGDEGLDMNEDNTGTENFSRLASSLGMSKETVSALYNKWAQNGGEGVDNFELYLNQAAKEARVLMQERGKVVSLENLIKNNMDVFAEADRAYALPSYILNNVQVKEQHIAPASIQSNRTRYSQSFNSNDFYRSIKGTYLADSEGKPETKISRSLLGNAFRLWQSDHPYGMLSKDYDEALKTLVPYMNNIRSRGLNTSKNKTDFGKGINSNVENVTTGVKETQSSSMPSAGSYPLYPLKTDASGTTAAPENSSETKFVSKSSAGSGNRTVNGTNKNGVNVYGYSKDWTPFVEAGLYSEKDHDYTDNYKDTGFQDWLKENYTKGKELYKWWTPKNAGRYFKTNNNFPTIEYLLGNGTSENLPAMYDYKYSDAHNFGLEAYKQYLADTGQAAGNEKLRPVVGIVPKVDSLGIPENKYAGYNRSLYGNAGLVEGWKPKKIDYPDEDKAPEYQTWLRYAPVVGSAIGVMGDLLGNNKPDLTPYRNLEARVNASPEASFAPIGNYMTYNPLDRNYYMAQLQNNGNAAMRAVSGASGNRGSQAANILAQSYAMNNNIGNTLMQMEQTNMQNRGTSQTFNRGTDQFNSTGFANASAANSQLGMSKLSMLGNIYPYMDSLSQTRRNGVSANLTNLFDNLGNVGKENMNLNMVNSNRSQYYGIDRNGNLFFKQAFYDLADADRKKLLDSMKDTSSGAFGGMLTVKKNKRRK